jgi:hypothetical protein
MATDMAGVVKRKRDMVAGLVGIAHPTIDGSDQRCIFLSEGASQDRLSEAKSSQNPRKAHVHGGQVPHVARREE